MSVFIPADSYRGQIVRAYMPHAGETRTWPRNLLVLGFVFQGKNQQPNALMTARLSFNDEHFYTHDIQFPGSMIGWLPEKLVTFRTNRIDIIPLSKNIFTPQLTERGSVRNADFWKSALPALESGLQAEDAIPSLYYKLRENDCVHEGPCRTTPVVQMQMPEMFRAMMNDYDRALIKRGEQLADQARKLQAAYRNLPQIFMPEAVIADAPAEEVVTPALPWWKENPKLLEQVMAEAAAQEKFRKVKYACGPEKSEIADLSVLTELFGVSIGKEKKQEPPAVSKTVKARKISKKAAPILTKDYLRDHAAHFRNLSDIFFTAFNPIINPLPGEVLQDFHFRRGQALRIKPLLEGTQTKAHVGLVWDIYRDRDSGRVKAVELIVCRRKNEDVEKPVEICDPLSLNQRSGFVASVMEKFRVPLTEDFVLENQPQEKPLNPVFLEEIAAKIVEGQKLKIYGIEDIPPGWEKDELEIAPVTTDDITLFRHFQMLEPIQPSPKKSPVPA